MLMPVDPQKIMRSWAENSPRIDLQPRLEVLFGENGLPAATRPMSGSPICSRMVSLSWIPPRGARHERDDAPCGPGARKMLLGGRLAEAEAQLVRDFRRASAAYRLLEMKRWMRRRICVWAGGKVGHFRLPVYIYSYCNYIQIGVHGKRPTAPSAP